jgi:muramoyltetrapeptide carboxypeptidase
MINPPSLTLGNTIGIVAPGRKLDASIIYQAKELIEARGFNVEFGPHLFSNAHSYLSALDNERLVDFQQMLDNPSIKVILCARGGYGTTRILDQLDFSLFQKNPKWICGFSDITALHLKLNVLGIQSIHGIMPVLFTKEDSRSSIDSLFKLLTGKAEIIEAPGSDFNRTGEATGELVGGNLSLLIDSLGTSSEINTVNKILVIEEIDEPSYKIDRMMVQLKRAGKLNKLAGLVVGHMTNIKEGELPFGESVHQIILNQVAELNYPVAFNFPIGHENPNMAWIEGGRSLFTVTKSGAAIKQI